MRLISSVLILARRPLTTNTTTTAMASNKLTELLAAYDPPEWAKTLKRIPECKVKLSMYDTPIHPWNIPGIPNEFKLHIKRDDLTGSTLSGNKVRKLEFLLGEAVNTGCTSIITCGGIQSNFARSAAVAARQLGLESHLLLRSEGTDPDLIGCEGNLLLNRMVGSHIYLIPRTCKYEPDIRVRMEKLAQKIDDGGGKSYPMEVGGSTITGLFGYIEGFRELMRQNVLEDFDDLVFTIGSGGTAAGLAIGNYLTGSKLKCHAFAVCDNSTYFHGHVNATLAAAGLSQQVKSEDILDVIEGAKGRGYGLSTDEELEFILKVSTTTGIMIDPVYTGKATKALVEELNNNPSRFKGKRILFVHTGGLFGLFDGRINNLLKKTGSPTNRVYNWMDSEELPYMES
ncbi:uncharacterized protein LOC100378838 [Saccoglossus kowalevskii]|uniref:Probable 1-aminocyclopropane-1-carboxylate deaminase-like n=1 Tax=Saccoglossus kowalevskii TaxID=10224 RepID=A0ABM0MTS7_SACKO|nr:PREDICTED: probable 1-aminocyclopropane-1-carboxylate deaminase-like [Saccoglossus kowalevskii]